MAEPASMWVLGHEHALKRAAVPAYLSALQVARCRVPGRHLPAKGPEGAGSGQVSPAAACEEGCTLAVSSTFVSSNCFCSHAPTSSLPRKRCRLPACLPACPQVHCQGRPDPARHPPHLRHIVQGAPAALRQHAAHRFVWFPSSQPPPCSRLRRVLRAAKSAAHVMQRRVCDALAACTACVCRIPCSMAASA